MERSSTRAPGSSGTYTIDTSTANGVCTGTLNFNGDAPNFDIYFGPSGDSDISLIQTDKGNVFRGTATREHTDLGSSGVAPSVGSG